MKRVVTSSSINIAVRLALIMILSLTSCPLVKCLYSHNSRLVRHQIRNYSDLRTRLRSSSISDSIQLNASSSGRNKSMRYFPINSKEKSYDLKHEELTRAKHFIDFLRSSPDPFHCVKSVTTSLLKAGFVELDESKSWKNEIIVGGKYFFNRNRSSIVAFAVGCKYKPGNAVKCIGAHTDSPNLKIKPNSKRGINNGIVQLSVECYGGGLWNTWFDRELSISGKCIVRDNDTMDTVNKLDVRLIHIEKPVLRIPNLCIHLRPADERDVMKLNKEEHLMPILCDAVKASLSRSDSDSSTGCNTTTSDLMKATSNDMDWSPYNNKWYDSQSLELIELIATELGLSDPKQIIDFDLSLYDTQPASLSGLNQEYIVGARIDNLASCFTALDSFVSHTSLEDEHGITALTNDEGISMIALFDHEEVGSESQIGAGSTLMGDAILRISKSLHAISSNGDGIDADELLKISQSKSFIISCDMAHAIHPNYANKHDKNHAPHMNEGIVLKSNANQRYATSGVTGFLIRELGRKVGVPVQEFSVRNDCPCGTTIGPTISANTGIRAVDVGMPQLSMHSIREQMGVSDLTFAYQLFREFYKSFEYIDRSLK